MAFGFLKRDKKKNEVKSSNSGNFWESCVVTGSLQQFGVNETGKAFVIPFDDIREKFIYESYLKDVLKSDSDLHRRTAALFILWTVRGGDSFGNYCDNLTSELNISENDLSMILDDFALLLMAKGDDAHIILG